jgi:hypothetical protein
MAKTSESVAPLSTNTNNIELTRQKILANFLAEYGIGILAVLFASVIALWVYANQKMSELGNRSASVDTRVSQIDERLNRIANALPDVRVRVAKEELAKPVSIAVVVTDAKKTSKGDLQRKIAVVNTKNGTVETLTVTAPASTADQIEKQVDIVVAGIVRKTDPKAITFADLDLFASEANVIVRSPLEISASNSYVFRDSMRAEIVPANFKIVTDSLAPGSWTWTTVTLPVKPTSDYKSIIDRLDVGGDLHKLVEVPATYGTVPKKP